MTDLLERAFAEASKLPNEAQDLLAQTLLDDLADEALAEYREGKTRNLDEVL